MIKKDPVFVWAINSKNKLKDPDSTGKWLIWGTKDFMEEIFPKINNLIDKGILYKAKYAHRENKNIDPYWSKDPILCVYADDSNKEKTLKELKKLGITPSSWKYDLETIEDWKPGGKLYEEVKKLRQKPD